MTDSRQSNCRRPLVRVLGDAARCNVCGAERGEPCRVPAGYLPAPGAIDMFVRDTPANRAELERWAKAE